MIGVFGHQDMGQQPGPWQSTLDRSGRCRGLGDAVAPHAGQLRAHMADHPKVRRHVIEHLRHILADRAHRRTAVRTTTAELMHDALPWQVIGQRPTHVRLSWRGHVGNRWGDRRGGFQIFQVQFQLLDLARQALRRSAELHAP
jgi:hypothetical protein